MSRTTERAVESTPDEELATFGSQLQYEDIPKDAVRLAERCFVDTIGVTLAGTREGAGKTAIGVIDSLNAQGPVRLLASSGSASVTDAAFANGTASHGLDFDDVSPGIGHPSPPLVSAIFSVGDAENVSGKDALTAYVAGFEAQQYLASAISDAHYARGWHSTSTFGTFGATVASASLLQLETDQLQHALNIAASMPAGLKKNFGSMTKPMHVGNSARAGITAAYLAQDGFSAADNAIGDDGGFLDLYCGGSPPDLESFPLLGEEWTLLDIGINVKKYPCCYFTHTSIAGAQYLVAEHDIDPSDVKSVDVKTSEAATGALHYSNPDTGLEGKFSMEYTVASAIARDRVGLEAFDDENIHDPAVQAVRQVVNFGVDPDNERGESIITIETTDGSIYSHTQYEPPGTHSNPLSDEELKEKFIMCANRAVSESVAEQAYSEINSLRNLPDIAELVDLLQ